MSPETPVPPIPEACRAALAAIEADPLNLPAEARTHLRSCPACAETRVQWLALEDAPAALVPAGYFERLPGRILGKLPARTAPKPGHPLLWVAAAALLLAGGTAGFLAGRANRTPMVEANIAPKPLELHETADTPFQEKDEVLTEVERLTPEQLRALAENLDTKKAR